MATATRLRDCHTAIRAAITDLQQDRPANALAACNLLLLPGREDLARTLARKAVLQTKALRILFNTLTEEI